MVVVCTSCQARFRVADEKVGPRGARVRCTKCKTVFPVGSPAPQPEAVDARPGATRFAAEPGPTPPAAPRRDDPFASPVAFELPAPSRPPAPDVADPFAAFAAASGKGAAIPEPTPFPDGALPDPTPVAQAGPAAGRKRNGSPASTLDEFLGSLPVTNLADLERPSARKVAGASAAGTSPGLVLEERTPVGIPVDLSPPPAIPEPEPYPGLDAGPDAFEAPTRWDGETTPGPTSLADAGPDGLGASPDAFAAAPAVAGTPRPNPEEARPQLDEVAEFHAALDAELGDLIDRTPGAPSPSPAHDPAGLAGDFGGGPAPAAARAAFPGAEAPVPPRAGDIPARAARGAPVRSRPAAAPGARGEEPGPVEGDVLGSGRLHGVLVNAVSLALLLVLTAAILLWWRGGSVLGLLGLRPGAAAGLSVERTTNGYYDTDSGRPLVFVRGQVTPRGTAPEGPVRVRAEMIRAGRVLASAEGTAGGVPTPEELAAVGSPGDEARLRAQLAARAPARPAIGQALPFVVMFVDAPADLGGVTFRVEAESAPRP
jgi:predicted Zn finger-like uncharacterized protein